MTSVLLMAKEKLEHPSRFSARRRWRGRRKSVLWLKNKTKKRLKKT